MSEQLTTDKSELKSQSLDSASQVLSEQDTAKAKAKAKSNRSSARKSVDAKAVSSGASPVSASAVATAPKNTQVKITLPKKQDKLKGPTSFTLDESHCKVVGDWKLNLNDADTLYSMLPSQKTLSIAKYIKTFAYHTGKLVSPEGDSAAWDVSRVSSKMQETMQHTYFSGHDKTLEDIFPKRYTQPSMSDLSQRYVLDSSINTRRLYKGYIRPIASAFLDERTYNILMPGQIVYLEPNEDLNPVLRPSHQISGIRPSRSSFRSDFTYEDGPDLPESAYLPYQPFKVEQSEPKEQPQAQSYNQAAQASAQSSAQTRAQTGAQTQGQFVQHGAPSPAHQSSQVSYSHSQEPRANEGAFATPRVQSVPQQVAPSAYQQPKQAIGYVPLASQMNVQLAQTLELAPQSTPAYNQYAPQVATSAQVHQVQAQSQVYVQQGIRNPVYSGQVSGGQETVLYPYQQVSPRALEPSFNYGNGVQGAISPQAPAPAPVQAPAPRPHPYPVPNGNTAGVATKQVAGISVVNSPVAPVNTISFMQWASQQRFAAGYEQALQELNLRVPLAESVSPDGGFMLDIAALRYLAQYALPNKKIRLPWLAEMGMLVADPFE